MSNSTAKGLKLLSIGPKNCEKKLVVQSGVNRRYSQPNSKCAVEMAATCLTLEEHGTSSQISIIF